MNPIPDLTGEEITKFWDKVDVRGPNDCWPWRGARNKPVGGYGRFSVASLKKKLSAHRISFFLEHDYWPEPNANHHCDHESCVNPAHLYEGDQTQNLRDAISRGRYPVGDQSHNSRLTPFEVRCIRNLFATGHFDHEVLALAFGVQRPNICKIVNRRNWKHVH